MIFMQDNAPKHASNYSSAWLASKGVKYDRIMTRPPSSIDLNPTENLQSLFKREIYSEGRQCNSLKSIGEPMVAVSVKVDGEQIKN